MRFLSWQKGVQACVFCFACLASAHADEGQLSENQRITSHSLVMTCNTGYTDLQALADDDSLPTLYVTDGQGYLAQGGFKAVLDDSHQLRRN